jgi:hypothetical protein
MRSDGVERAVQPALLHSDGLRIFDSSDPYELKRIWALFTVPVHDLTLGETLYAPDGLRPGRYRERPTKRPVVVEPLGRRVLQREMGFGVHRVQWRIGNEFAVIEVDGRVHTTTSYEFFGARWMKPDRAAPDIFDRWWQDWDRAYAASVRAERAAGAW